MNKRQILTAPALFLLGTFALSPVLAANIDFEAFPAGTNITNQIPGVSISATGGIDQAWIFDTDNFTGGDSDLEAPFTEINGGPMLSPGKVLIIQENNGGEPDDLAASGGIFDILFDVATTLFSIDFFDMEQNTIIQLFSDSFSTQIGGNFSTGDSDTADNSTANEYEHLVFNAAAGVAGVKSIRITMAGSGAIDNISHRVSVPLPAMLWLFGTALAGFAGLSYYRR